MFARHLTIGQSHLTRLKTDAGTISSKPAILREIEGFYGQLYTLSRTPSPVTGGDRRAKLSRHYTDDLPDVSVCEIRIALEQLKNYKAPGDDGITTELMKAGGKLILNELQKLFNAVVNRGLKKQYH